MMNNAVLSLPHILLFAPLLLSALFNLISDKKLLHILAMSSVAALLSIAFKIMLALNVGENIFVDAITDINILGSDFVVNIKNMTLISAALVINFFYLLNLNYENFFIKQPNVKFKKVFYSMYFLQIFSVIGIFTTYNVYHLFLFIEIFNFSFFNALSAYRSREINASVYKFYTNNVFGSVILCIAIFYLSIYFNTNNVLSIKQQLSTINLGENFFIAFILILITIGFMLSFLMFNVKTSDLEKRNFNILTINNIFISATIGLYLINYFVFDLFSFKVSIFTIRIIQGLILLFMSYKSIMVFFVRNYDGIYKIFLNFVTLSMCHCLMGLFIPNKAATANIMMFRALENITINFPIFLIGVYLSEVRRDSDYKLLADKKYAPLRYLLAILIVSKIYMPLTAGYYSDKILFKFFLESRNYFAIALGAISKTIVFAFLAKFLLKTMTPPENPMPAGDFHVQRLKRFKLSLAISILLLTIFMAASKKFFTKISANNGVSVGVKHRSDSLYSLLKLL
ncbi:MAG: hypothetical protein LBB09_02815 [Rickettsiales bacterium]|jgi:formate hydrogenlyase subunit 3/multisubunit Na+/H+ antiporter MnhD subunit|nr:hypothetical protein [Rickettsiales bacterium]